MSVWRVAAAAEGASQQCRETFDFLMNLLQALHDRITGPAGLLSQQAIHGPHPANRHAEVQLRQLRMGLHQALAMCRQLTALVAEEASKIPGHHRHLADAITGNQLVLAQLTSIAGLVNQRVAELSAERGRHDGGFLENWKPVALYKKCFTTVPE